MLLNQNFILYNTRWVASSSIITRRFARQVSTKTAPAKKSSSHLKTKLKHFIETGEVLKYTPLQLKKLFERQKGKQLRQIKVGSYSPQKALLLLKSKYGAGLQSDNGDLIDTESIKVADLKVTSERSLPIFEGLLNFKKATKKPIDERLLLLLLGSNKEQIRDPYLVTKDVLKLLERDGKITRAVNLSKLAGNPNGIVGMNVVLEWLLKKGDVKSAFKNFNDRKKWGIPANEHTYVILFDSLSKCHAWGDVSDSIALKCSRIFEDLVEKCKTDKNFKKNFKLGIEHFNSCLSLLMKNFTDDQSTAWSFFDLLIPDDSEEKTINIKPDAQTFTIFLNGIRQYYYVKVDKVLNDSTISKNKRTLELFALQGKLVSLSQLILNKLMKEAMPPPPPSREEASANPELLAIYRNKIKATLPEIDPAFASVFISTLTNPKFSTGPHISSGSHYRYVQQGIDYLRFWCPEVESLLHYIQTRSEGSDVLQPTPGVRERCDHRLHDALELPEVSSLKMLAEDENIQDLLPAKVLPNERLTMSDVNPLVIFPPSLLSKNKLRAIFSGKQKRLVDFSRLSRTDIEQYIENEKKQKSKGANGKRLSKSTILFHKNTGINRYILQLFVDCLAQLGHLRELYISIWYILTKWGGIYIKRDEMASTIVSRGIEKGVLDDSVFPRPKARSSPALNDDSAATETSSSGSATPSMTEKLELTPPHEPDVVDILLVENFIYKLTENKALKEPAASLVEIFSVLVNEETNVRNSLKPRDKTVDAVFASLVKQLHYYNDSNLNRGIYENRESKVSPNTPKKSLSVAQLEFFLVYLERFMASLHVYTDKAYGKNSYISPAFVQSYEKIITRIYNSTWLNTDVSTELLIHKHIIKSGILTFRPRHVVKTANNASYTDVIKLSLDWVFKHLSNETNLKREDVNLMFTLRKINNLSSTDESVKDRMSDLARKCYAQLF